MKLVILESPYAGDVARNIAYARACMADSLRRGEAPFASHLLYTQDGVLDDTVPEERALGMVAGFAWGEVAHLRVVYTDLGISNGMRSGIAAAGRLGQPVEYRTLPEWNEGKKVDIEWDHQDIILTVRVAAQGKRSDRVRALVALFHKVSAFHGCPAKIVSMQTVESYESRDDDD